MDPWFLSQLSEIAALEAMLRAQTPATLDAALLRRAKRAGFADSHLARLLSRPDAPFAFLEVRRLRRQHGHPAHLPARGYLRRRIRIADALSLQRLRDRR